MKRTLTVCLALTVLITDFSLVIAKVMSAKPSPVFTDYTLWQHSLGTETPLASSATGVSAATTGIVNFINYRSGVSINSETVSLLNERETKFQNHEFTGYTRSELKTMINAVWSDIFASICTSGICSGSLTSAYLGTKWRVYPDAQTGVVQPRNSMMVYSSNWPTFTNDYKNNTANTDGGYARSETQTQLNSQIDGLLDIYKEAVSSWNVTVYSPQQAFMLTYAVILDEHLGGNASDLAATIQASEDWLYTNKNVARSSSGRKAFGANGYLYASPADVLFSATVQNNVLSKLAALR